MSSILLAGRSRRESAPSSLPKQVLFLITHALTGMDLDRHQMDIGDEFGVGAVLASLATVCIAIILALIFLAGWVHGPLVPTLLSPLAILSGLFIILALRGHTHGPACILLFALIYWPVLLPILLVNTTDALGEPVVAPILVVGTLLMMSVGVILRPAAAASWLAITGLFMTIAIVTEDVSDLTLWVGLVGMMFTGVLMMIGRQVIERLATSRGRLETLMHRLRPGEDVETTAHLICTEVLYVGNFDMSAIILFTGPNCAVLVGEAASEVVRRPNFDLKIGKNLPAQGVGYLQAQAAKGSWVSPSDQAEGGASAGPLQATDIPALLFAPIVYDDEVLGVLVAAQVQKGPNARKRAVISLRSKTAITCEAASFAGALLWPHLAEFASREAESRRLREAIDTSAFRPVFQPIVNLARGTVVGFEALTRFTNGVAPDAMFASAARLGLELELELATMSAAITASEELPNAHTYLSLNFSPDLLLSGRANEIIAAVSRPIIIEITEHVVVNDYARLRETVDAFGPNVRLAVDDAGAGFASLRHVLELGPDLVKLDIGLIHGINADRARQALVAGMVHFAREGHFKLLAEGVETRLERRELMRLGVELGQGYLFGKPAAAADYASAGSLKILDPTPFLDLLDPSEEDLDVVRS